MEIAIAMTIGENIKHYRENRKLTQPVLADMLRVSKGAISQYENNLTTPSMDKLISLAKIFEISLADLIDVTVNDESVTNTQTGNHNRNNINYKSGDMQVTQEDALNKLKAAEEKIQSLERENQLLKEINQLLKNATK